MRQRGSILMYGLLALAIIGGVLLVFQWLDNNWITDAGIAKGEANIKARWDKANKDAQDKADAERRRNTEIVAAEQAKRQIAESQAADYAQKWRKAREDARNKPLAIGTCPPQAGQTAEAVPADIRFTHRFVGLWDGAWTGRDGKPVFSDSASGKTAGADPDARSPYGPSEAIDNHAENARRCSAARRDLNALIDTIERLQGKR